MPLHSSSASELSGTVRNHPSWALVERVAGSDEFRKSVRLQGLLKYLCARALSHSETEVREQDIGRDVFQRASDYSTTDDSIVRVQVSNLRKRIEEYFAGSGSCEPVMIRIPRGSYLPEFVRRENDSVDQPAIGGATTKEHMAVWILGVLSSVLGIAVVLLLLQTRMIENSPAREAAGQQSSPVFRALFPNDRRVHLVLADSTFGLFQHFSQRPVSLSAYLNREYEHWVAGLPPRYPMREVFRNILGRRYTSIADAMLVAKMYSISGQNQNRISVWSARDFQTRDLRGDNTVLIGARRSNPWVELFEDKLNWRLRAEVADEDIFENRAPLAGEPRECRGDGRSQAPSGFCQVALLPNPDGTGYVILIGGTEMTASEAGVNLLFTEEGLALLRRRLGLTPGASLPYFEVLLNTKRAGDAPAGFVIISHRLPRLGTDNRR